MQKLAIIAFCILSLNLSGCKKPNPTPELIDPIYLDLRTKVKEFETQVLAEQKTLESLKKELDAAEPQSGDRKRLIPKVEASNLRLTQYQQMQRYYTLRAQTRITYARKSYLNAFKNDQDWPDQQEYERYLTNQRLMTASRTWKPEIPTEKREPSAGVGAGH